MRLSDILSGVSRPERVQPTARYCVLGVRWYAKGLFLKEKLGREIKAKYLYRVETNDLIYNRLFAWKGSFSIVDSRFAGAYVSNEFPCFRVDERRAITQFLMLFLSRQSVWDEATALSTGASRQSRLRLKQEPFLSIKLYLPELPEQQELISRVQQIVVRARDAHGLRETISQEQSELLSSMVSDLCKNAARCKMSEVAPVVRRPIVIDKSRSYPELGVRSFGKGTFHKPAVNGADLGSKRLYRIEPGDLLFSNVFAWEGAIAVAEPEDVERFGSHRFITCVPDPSVTRPSFLCRYFLTKEGIAQIRAASPGAAGRNRTLGIKKLEAIEVPVPPLRNQEHYSSIHERVMASRRIQSQITQELDALVPSVLERAFDGEL